jgi:hypothetical protein
MANEIAITTKMVLANGTLKDRSEPGVKYVTQATAEFYKEVQTWSTSDTALACGSLATSSYGYCRFTNTDSTNYADIGPESGGAIIPMIRLLAGESSGWMRIKPSVTLRRQANTASVKVLVEMLRA